MSGARIAGVALVPLTLSMRSSFITALGEKRISRNLLVALRLESGIVGYGEASASLAWPEETQAAMTKALAPLTRSLLGKEIRPFQRLVREVWEKAGLPATTAQSGQAGRHPAAASALESALLDAFTRNRGIPLWRWIEASLPFGKGRRIVTTGLTLSAWEPSFSARIAARATLSGFRRFKIKVTGRDLDSDIRRIVAVHQAAPQATLWIDGNQGFTPKEALQFCLFLRQQRLPVRLFEQPVAKEDLEGLAQVNREGKIPVAADESLRTLEDARRLIRVKAASVFNIKLAKCGLIGALSIARLAKSTGTGLMIGCMAESAMGLSTSVHLACGSGAFDFIDLDSHLLVISPPGQPGFIARGARLSVHPTRSGTGAQFGNSFNDPVRSHEAVAG